MLTELTDEQLVNMCQAGGMADDGPFQELFRRYYTAVWRACYGFMGNAQDADDLAQDAFVKAYRYLDRFEKRSSFKTWIYRIAINTCNNEVRHRRRRPAESEMALMTAAQFLPAGKTTEQLWEERVQQRRLATALAYLRPEESEILLLKDLEERPYAEIADTLSISLSAAKMRAKRARKALKVAYMQASGDEYILKNSAAAG